MLPSYTSQVIHISNACPIRASMSSLMSGPTPHSSSGKLRRLGVTSSTKKKSRSSDSDSESDSDSDSESELESDDSDSEEESDLDSTESRKKKKKVYNSYGLIPFYLILVKKHYQTPSLK